MVRSHSPRSVVMNLVVLVSTWVVLFALIRLANAVESQLLLLNGAECLAAAIGLLLAWRLHARVASYVLAAFGAYAAVLFAIHHGVDARAAQGGAVHMAVLGAAAIGVFAGGVLARRTRVAA